MSLAHALLTALAEKPSSGSELASRFDRSIGYFWQASHQQIYRELKHLETAGWIESLPEETTRGRKRAYQLVQAGRQELKRWITQEDQPTPLRDEMMVRLWGEAALGPTGMEKAVRNRLRQHQEKLALYRKIELGIHPSKARKSREAALQHLVLDAGIQYETYWIQLTQKALDILESKDSLEPPAEYP